MVDDYSGSGRYFFDVHNLNFDFAFKDLCYPLGLPARGLARTQSG